MSGTKSDRPTAESTASTISKAVLLLLSEYTGQRPSTARTYINEDLIVVVLHDTLTREEQSIIRDGGIDLVLVTREAFHKAMKPDLIAIVERLSGRSTIACLSHNHVDPERKRNCFVERRPVCAGPNPFTRWD